MLRAFAIAAALAFAAFVTDKGIPTLRHDWNWPVDRLAIPSFLNESLGGWMSTGFGAFNAHPTTYLIALPIGLGMWLLGPLVALVLLAIAIGYLCMRAAAQVSQHWNCGAPGAVGIGLFVLFNPWVYSEVVAGHLVMVLAYAGIVGLLAEMLRGAEASPVRLALWLVLVESQLQFFILAMLALVAFACVTKKWLPPVAGVIFGLPSAVGLIAERSTILQTPYSLAWQANQSVAPGALSALGGYFAGYADRLGPAASVAVWAILALALAGVVAGRGSRAVIAATCAAVVLYATIAGVHGPFALPYEWVVRRVPESGVFRELYDLAGILAALLAVLTCAALAAVPQLRYVALAAGATLLATWLTAPPSNLWVGAASYRHPAITAPPFTRVALLPAFQPLELRGGGGDGADPDVHTYPDAISALNEYLPTYPVDMALARYEQSGDVAALRALGVSQVVPRAWLISRSNGRVGLAAPSLAPQRRLVANDIRYLAEPTPLISTCETPRVVTMADTLGACDVFFGDAGAGYPAIVSLRARSDTIDPRTNWIDARLAFAEAPELAQGIGGALTQSDVSYPIEPGSALLAYVRGALMGSDGRTLLRSPGGLRWLSLPANVTAVTCNGLCELVAESRYVPKVNSGSSAGEVSGVPFRAILPWLYVVEAGLRTAPLLRLNERYDAAWAAISGWRVLPHVRVDAAVNGWFFGERRSSTIILVQVTSFLQIVAEICGLVCVLCLLKAVSREPTKRAP
jgi:hypothetical protein